MSVVRTVSWVISRKGSWPLLGVALLLATVAPAHTVAQEVTARAFLTPTTVGLNRQFVLNVEVTGTQRTDTDPELPVMGSFARYLGASSSTNMQMINGVTTVSLIVQYRYQAVEEGTFDIGPVTVRAGGRVLGTEPVTLTVSAAPAPPPGAGPPPEDPSGVSSEDLFVVAEVSKRRVYENEPVVVQYRLFTRVNVSSYSITQTAGSEGFWVEDVPQTQSPQVEQVVRGGVPYAQPPSSSTSCSSPRGPAPGPSSPSVWKPGSGCSSGRGTPSRISSTAALSSAHWCPLWWRPTPWTSRCCRCPRPAGPRASRVSWAGSTSRLPSIEPM